jgi:purine-nucleoside phosphorylase
MKGIVQPIVTSKTPRIGPLGVLSATRVDLSALIDALGMENRHPRSLYMSQLHLRDDGVFLSGPLMGAPYSVMILETLAAWGAKQILFMGWCGTISATVSIGDILVPTLAWIDEGTSQAYSSHPIANSSPSDDLTCGIKSALLSSALPFHEGAVWTTDAIFRETPDKVMHFREKGALAVEMELSALFTVSTFLGIAFSAILVVSDDVSSLTWKPGFKDTRFMDTRHKLAAVIAEISGQNPYSASRTRPGKND